MLVAALAISAGSSQRMFDGKTRTTANAANGAFDRVELLHAACVKDMIASTCKVMGTAAASTPLSAKPSELVFIAGVGAISAVDYQQMYEAGDAMCSVVKKACAEDWTSGRCQTARKLLLTGGGV